MAAQTDPRAVKFANEKIRPLCDLMISAYLTAVAMMEQWNAQQMGNLIPFTADLIVDGATVNGIDAVGGDGRPLMRCQDAEQIFNVAAMLINLLERGTVDGSGTQNFANRTLLMAQNVNGKSLY